MAQMYPETETTDAAEEGTASHEVGALDIHAGLNPQADVCEVLDIGDAASNGVIVTEEMKECAGIYSTGCLSILNFGFGDLGASYGIEDQVSIEAIHAECFGTVDFWAHIPSEKELYVCEYKYGHLFVDVFENAQLICYATGLARKLNLDQDTTVIFRITQPRAYGRGGPTREWRVKLSGLNLLISQLAVKAAQALGPNPTLQTGSHCRYCQARNACPEALKAGIGFYEMASQVNTYDMSPEALGLQLRIVERAQEQLKALASSYREQVMTTIKAGGSVPGWEAIPAMGREAWNRPIDEVLYIGKLMGKDLSKPGVVTPNQARKLGMDADIVALYAGKPNKGMKIVPQTETKIKKAFYHD
jgi:hypothetical protein